MTFKTGYFRRPSRNCVHFDLAPPEIPEDVVGREISGHTIVSDRQMSSALSTAFAFPSYFGNNWDAVDECLRDLEWLPGSSYALVVNNAKPLWARAPETAGRLVESWLFCAADWAEQETPFHLIFVW